MVLAGMPTTYQDGDLILRRGEGIFSDIARLFYSTDKRFSHVGIMITIQHRPYVIHSIQEESKGYNGVVIEALQHYLKDIRDWSVYRLELPREQRSRMAIIALDYAQQKIPFDPYFDLSTQNTLYCTELIWQVANKAAQPNPVFTSTTQSDIPFISIENIYKNDKAYLVETIMDPQTDLSTNHH